MRAPSLAKALEGVDAAGADEEAAAAPNALKP